MPSAQLESIVMTMNDEEHFQLVLQVLSYRSAICWNDGDLRVFAINNGRCNICSCSAFRHKLLPLYPPQCRNCPTNTMRAHNSVDLAGMTMPQFCHPDSPLRRTTASGPIRLKITAEEGGMEWELNAPKVTYPKLEGPVTKASEETLYEMQDRRCNACFQNKPIGDLTYDHRVPKSKSGMRSIENAELMCAPCNHAKGNRDMFDFLYEKWRSQLPRLS